MDERVWVEEERTVRKTHVALLEGLEVVLGDGGLADGAGAEVDDLVSVVPDLGVELRHAGLRPVPPDHGQQVAQHVRLGDGAVNVRYHDLKRIKNNCYISINS